MPKLIALCILLIATAGQVACAEPNAAELSGYCCLVPDYSKTSGGISPAMSPDGKHLAYLTPYRSGPDAYSAHGIGILECTPDGAPNPAKTWWLTIEFPGSDKPDNYSGSDDRTRDLDWSPDGKRFALIYRGRLFIAEDFDFAKRAVKTRLIAEPRSAREMGIRADQLSDGKQIDTKCWLQSPRWSPDGTKIALARPFVSPIHAICVVDATTSKETILARDAGGGLMDWDRPWSPDSKRLVYSSAKWLPDKSVVESGGLSVAMVDGSGTKKIFGRSNTGGPSWSPKSDLIAFWTTAKTHSSSTPAIFVCDSMGKRLRQVTQPCGKATSPSAEMEAAARKRSRLWLMEHYPGRFTTAQLNRLSRSSECSKLAAEMAGLVELRIAAVKIGGATQRRAEQIAKAYAETGKLDERTIKDALKQLPKDVFDRAAERATAVLTVADGPIFETMLASLRYDNSPVWSPDGKSLAFVRAGFWNTNSTQLMAVDLATQKTRTLLDSASICAVSWANNGTATLLEETRDLALRRSPQNDTSTIPGYPEIWLLDLKP
jgi:Tol biopolymer transport system component